MTRGRRRREHALFTPASGHVGTGLAALSLATADEPAEIRVRTSGMNISVTDGKRVIGGQLASGEEARAVAQGILFWAKADPTRPLEKLVAYAIEERRNAVRAQRRRRFGRAFPGSHVRPFWDPFRR